MLKERLIMENNELKLGSNQRLYRILNEEKDNSHENFSSAEVIADLLGPVIPNDC